MLSSPVHPQGGHPHPHAYRRPSAPCFRVRQRRGQRGEKAHMLIDSVMSFDSVLMILSLAAEKRPCWCWRISSGWTRSAPTCWTLLHKADSSRILFAATCRQPAGRWPPPCCGWLEKTACALLHPLPFTKDETMEFIQSMGPESPQADKERIYQDTQGNAFPYPLIGHQKRAAHRPARNMEEILSCRLSVSRRGLQVLNLVAMFPDRAPYPVLERGEQQAHSGPAVSARMLCRRSILTEVYGRRRPVPGLCPGGVPGADLFPHPRRSAAASSI